MHLHMDIEEWVKIWKNAILITCYTPCDKERMRFSSYTSHIRWFATMFINRNWWIIGWQIIRVLL